MTHPLRVFQELLGEVIDRSSRPDESRGLLTADEREAAGVPEGQADVSSPSSFENEERPRRDERAEHRVLGQWTGRVDRNKIPAEGMARRITSAYEVCDANPPVLYPRCMQCFRISLE